MAGVEDLGAARREKRTLSSSHPAARMIVREPTLLDLLGVCLNLPESERTEWRVLSGQEFDPDTAAATMWAVQGPRWCMADEHGMPVVVCGYARMQPGVFRSWYYATAEAWEKHGAEVTHVVRELIAGMLKGEARRLETVTLARSSKIRDWCGRIGLEHESTFKSFGLGGEAAVMYVATRDVN